MTDTARVTVTLTEPVAAARRLRTDFTQDTHDHIPGTVLRGALAAAWIREHGAPDPDSRDFLDIFEGDGSFGPLHSPESFPVPLSYKQHKYAPGPGCRRWWDEATEKAPQQCCCGQDLENGKGEPARNVARVTRARVALTEEGVAVNKQLFTQSSLASDTVLTGWVHGPAVRALRLNGTPVDTLYLGGRRSIQGAATVDVDFAEEPGPVEQIEKSDGSADVVLRLLSPGIFVDGFGMPADEPDLREISAVLGVEVRGMARKSWTRWTEVGGWHAASGLPKPTERAVQQGSTYVLHCAEPASESARRTLMARGVGLRRREGFGALYGGIPGGEQ